MHSNIGKTTIRLIQKFELEIDGQKVEGEFRIESQWNGLVALKSDSPSRTVIIKHPPRPSNQFDNLPTIFGGNLKSGNSRENECEIISRDFRMPLDPKEAGK